ncbi:6-phosphogluconolactonase [Cylas formicarius]|uniref:6-phosphogluconolactonase n=1 Tax=Cylas formicarius TaxID=197179 RepID=UPI002958D94F|nr:6-phosphogluconolactonase [Cylas formicarius]
MPYTAIGDCQSSLRISNQNNVFDRGNVRVILQNCPSDNKLLVERFLHTMSVIVEAEDRENVISKLSEVIKNAAYESIALNGIFNVGVSGGSLVSFLAAGLPKIKTDFTKWRIFFCDERVVPEDDPDSTFGAYKNQLVDNKNINLREDQFVTIKQGVSADDAAKAYSDEIAKYLPGNPLPQFDMLLLGMGPDGHTCSLFPGHKLLNETERWVAPITDSPKPPPSRITLTFPVINNAKACVFAISGKDKADMIKRILLDKEDLPAARVQPASGRLYWILDKEAGVHLPK